MEFVSCQNLRDNEFEDYEHVLKPGTTVNYVGLNSIRPQHGLPMLVKPIDQPNPVVPLKGNIHTLGKFPETK